MRWAPTPQGRGFAHGLLSASWALGAITRARPALTGGADPSRFVTAFEVRFADVVSFGATLAFRCEEDGADDTERRSTFECLSDDGRVVTTGAIELGSGEPRGAGDPPWQDEASELVAGGAAWGAEDFAERGPRGARPVRTITEADVVAWTGFTGDLDPRWLHAGFAASTPFRERTAPPMLAFCLGFSTWLEILLSMPLAGAQTSAGHLGDRWRFVGPIRIGDSLEVRYRPLGMRRTRSTPIRGIVTYGLQLLNQRGEVVQQGEVDLMMAVREPASLEGGC